MQHTARKRPGVMDLDVVAEAAEMVGCRKTARTCAHNKNALAGRRGNRRLPSLLAREIAQKALNGVDAYRAVEVIPITARLARVIADASVNGGQRVVFYQLKRGFLEPARLCMGKPGLDVFACGASVVAWRQKADIGGLMAPGRAGSLLVGQVHKRRHIVRLHRHGYGLLERDRLVIVSCNR